MTLWSMGINQSHVGTDKNAAILNLHLATGQIGRPGAGPFSLTGQPNAMGGRETGGLSHLLPGYRQVERPGGARGGRAALGRARRDASRRAPGRSALEIFEGLAAGEVRAVWILCTNPAASMPDLDLVEKALRQAELVIVQDAYHPTETTRFADVLLPAAQWPEKDGVMTNSERRLTLPAEAGRAAGRGAARRRHRHARSPRELGCKDAFAYESAAEIFDEFAALTAGTAVRLLGRRATRGSRADGPLQWPCRAPTHPGTARLYTDGRFPTPDGRARFVAGRARRARRAARRALSAHADDGPRARPLAHADAHRQGAGADAPARRSRFSRSTCATPGAPGIQDGDFVEVTSRRGKAVAQCRVSDTIRAGHVLPAVPLGPAARASTRAPTT